MSKIIAINVPDIGNFKDIPVIEILVKVGETVTAEQSLVTLETDKATMDVPAPAAGVVRELKVKVGDTVSEGSVILILETQDARSGIQDSAKAQTPPAPPLSGGEVAITTATSPPLLEAGSKHSFGVPTGIPLAGEG